MPTLSLDAAIHRVTNMALNWEQMRKNAVARVHALLSDPQHARHHETLEQLFELLINPASVNNPAIKGVADYVVAQINAGCPIDPSIIAGLKHYAASLPPQAVQDLVMQNEHLMAGGKYEHFLEDDAKKKAETAEARLKNDPELKAAWESFYGRHSKWCNRRRVARRTLMKERNMEPEDFEPTPDACRQFELDAISYRWVLWGFEKGAALLQKLTVNVTPYGINIFIPRWWSFDYTRDLNWRAILDVLRFWGTVRQGEKLHLTQTHVEARALATLQWYEDGQKNGFRGNRLMQHVIEKAPLSTEIDKSSFYRILRHGKKLRKDK